MGLWDGRANLRSESLIGGESSRLNIRMGLSEINWYPLCQGQTVPSDYASQVGDAATIGLEEAPPYHN